MATTTMDYEAAGGDRYEGRLGSTEPTANYQYLLCIGFRTFSR